MIGHPVDYVIGQIKTLGENNEALKKLFIHLDDENEKLQKKIDALKVKLKKEKTKNKVKKSGK